MKCEEASTSSTIPPETLWQLAHSLAPLYEEPKYPLCEIASTELQSINIAQTANAAFRSGLFDLGPAFTIHISWVGLRLCV